MRKNVLKSRPLPKRSSNIYQPIVHPVRHSDTRETIGWAKWAFLFVCGGFLFFLGVYAGRITVPVYVDEKPIEKTLAELKQVEEAQQEEARKSDGKALTETDLDFYDDLRSKKYSIASPPVQTPAIKRDTETQPQVKRPLSPKKDFRIVSRAVKPGKTVKTEPAPSSSSDAASASHLYAIQVASFALAKDADQMVAKLKRKGYSGAYVTDDNIPGIGVRYRVKVGYYKTQSDARKPLEKLRLKERLTDAYIFKRK